VSAVASGPRAGPARSARFVVLAVCLMAVACSDCCPSTGPLTAAQQRRIHRWLQCEECLSGELDSVLALADCKRGATVDSLRRALSRGPEAARLQNLALQLSAAFEQDSLNAGKHGLVQPRLTSSAFLTRFTRNYVATWRGRAATALVRLRTVGPSGAVDPAVKAALDSAVTFTDSPDSVGTRVRDAVRRALARHP